LPLSLRRRLPLGGRCLVPLRRRLPPGGRFCLVFVFAVASSTWSSGATSNITCSHRGRFPRRSITALRIRTHSGSAVKLNFMSD
jgi:hypothetical protein